MAIDKRAIARELAARAQEERRPLSWFEELYQKARDEGARVPWADLVPNPHVVPLVERLFRDGTEQRALKIGCGYGDDAEWLAARGFEVTAFDIAPTAIAECTRRFPHSSVRYKIEDLFEAPEEWVGRFDLVWESYTLQVLPPNLRDAAIRVIPQFLAPNGYLVVVARGREADESEGAMPWPLTRAELNGLGEAGLPEVQFDDHVDEENPPVRRFRAVYQRRLG